jgi:UDP-GlcNAc:undecaprenyl-phosphate GlcNAc-1-phosphate transferase
VFILWAWTALLSGFVLYPTVTGRGNGIVPIGLLALGLMLFTVLHPSLRRRAEPDADDVGADDVTDRDGPHAQADVVDLARRRASGS